MANTCDNTFYAYSEDENNIHAIIKFFEEFYKGCDYEHDNDHIDVYFESKWSFPLKYMEMLLHKIPNKDDIYMRCLSLDLENLYHELWISDGTDWECV
jgi:hypothetical protein